MNRNNFLKTSGLFLGGIALFGCDKESLEIIETGTGSNNFSLTEAKDWYLQYISQKGKPNSRVSVSDFAPVWELAYSVSLQNGHERVIAPIRYMGHNTPAFSFYNDQNNTPEDKAAFDVVNYGKINLLITKKKDSSIDIEVLLVIPDKEYTERKSNIIEAHDLSGKVVILDFDQKKLISMHKFKDGAVIETSRQGTNPNGRPSLTQQVCTDYYYYTCVNGSCSEPTYNYTSCETVYADVSDTTVNPNVGQMPTLITYSKQVAQSTNYVNMYSYVNEETDWTTEDKPCESFTYGGESNLSSSELFCKIVVEEAMNQLGITDIAAALGILGGANIISTRTKLALTTNGTSLLSKYVSPLIPWYKEVRFPTLTGFPGVGSGLKLTATKGFGRFVTRGIPVIGYGMAAYDAYVILSRSVDKYQTIKQTSGCI